jgi:hypothetical protein
MAVAINSLYNEIRAELPGIPEPLLANGVRKAIQEFFRKSEAWRYSVPGLLDWTMALTFPALAAGTEIPTGTRVIRVDELKYASDGTSLQPVEFQTQQDLDGDYPDWEVKTGSSPLRWTNDGDGGTPRIVPIASADVLGSLKVRVILAPIDSLTELPDALFYDFEDDFKHGALARLMKIPGKDWTDIPAASAYMQMFKAGIIKAQSRANAEFGQPCRETSYGGI